MKIAIIEDEILAANKLEKLVIQYDPQNEVIAKLDSVEASVEWLKLNTKPDLIFLDIRLSDGTSFDIIKAVDISSPVIFTTAYDEYALEAFSLYSIDYLVKPVSFEKLAAAFDKLKAMKKSLVGHSATVDLKQIKKLIDEQKKGYKTRFLVKLGSQLKSVATEQVSYFYSEEKLVFLRTASNERYVINQSLDELENLLDPNRFFRINRQFIVNFDAIKKVHPHFKGRLKIELTPPIEDEVYISSRRSTPFKEWMDL